MPSARYYHQARLGDAWADVYEYTLEQMPAIDREVGNWWTSTSPQSKFRQNLMVALARPDGTRVSVLNREFTHRRGGEVLERFELADTEELLTVLAERFGLRLAVSLALALGRFAAGKQRPIEAVIIGEGFGSLDQDGLRAMAENLQELRRAQSLKRILLVSHQKDFTDQFAYGYSLAPSEQGTKAVRLG